MCCFSLFRVFVTLRCLPLVPLWNSFNISDLNIRLHFRYIRLRIILAILRFSGDTIGITRFNVVYTISFRGWNDTSSYWWDRSWSISWCLTVSFEMTILSTVEAFCPFSLKTCFRTLSMMKLKWGRLIWNLARYPKVRRGPFLYWWSCRICSTLFCRA